MSVRNRPLALALSLLAAGPVLADTPVDEPLAAIVQGMHSSELKSYRVMLAGLDAFEEFHTLAPDAPEMRFRLRPTEEDADMGDLALRIAGEDTSLAVPVAADNTFILPPSELVADDNADLQLNKPKSKFRWQPDIRSLGVPENMRRLGDLRLEAKVKIATAKAEMSFMLKSLVNSLLRSADWAMHEKILIPTTTARQLAKATLLHGDQRIALDLTPEGHGFQPPIRNKAYPDDALIELVYA